MNRTLRTLAALTVALALGFGLAQFQPRNVECIAPAGAGGGWDLICRQRAGCSTSSVSSPARSG